MAGSYNKVLLMGNLTRDVEVRHTSGNQAVANLGLAVNRRYKTASGESREEVTFVDCEAWGRTAEVMAQYLAKGRPVFIEGRLKLDQWESKDGTKQSKLKVVVDTFQFVDSGGGQGGGGGGQRGGSRGGGGGGGGGQRYEEDAPAGARSAPADDFADDDIPF
ncbi:MAG: single-stranded DNA-binding protein [Phycisphaerales bacterium]|nr:MAG: single-stranded DNA-binding protein [Phycisphaerales bacterium]